MSRLMLSHISMSRNEVSGDKVLTKMLGIVFIIRSESQAYNKVVSIKSKSKYNPNKSKDKIIR